MQNIFVEIEKWMDSYLLQICMALMATVLTLYDDDIIIVFKKRLRNQTFMVRVTVFVLMCAIVFGVLTVVGAELLVKFLRPLGVGYWLIILVGAFIIVGIAELRKNYIIESNENFIPATRKKFELDHDQLTPHEDVRLLAWIKDRRKKGKEVTLKEECYFLLEPEEDSDFEHYLFNSSDDEFLEKLPYFASLMNDEDFNQMFQKIPNRIGKLRREGKLR